MSEKLPPLTPRQALYHLTVELGPTPMTHRDDNVTPKEARLRDAIAVLQELVTAEEKRLAQPAEELQYVLELSSTDVLELSSTDRVLELTQ